MNWKTRKQETSLQFHFRTTPNYFLLSNTDECILRRWRETTTEQPWNVTTTTMTHITFHLQEKRLISKWIMFSFFLFHKKQMFLLIIVGEKCHVTLWLNPLSRVSFGDTVATPKKKIFTFCCEWHVNMKMQFYFLKLWRSYVLSEISNTCQRKIMLIGLD